MDGPRLHDHRSDASKRTMHIKNVSIKNQCESQILDELLLYSLI